VSTFVSQHSSKVKMILSNSLNACCSKELKRGLETSRCTFQHFYSSVIQKTQGKSIQLVKSHEEVVLGYPEKMRELGSQFLSFIV